MLKFVTAFIMLVGLGFTVVPRVPGTVIILAGALLYGTFTGFISFEPWLWTSLIVLLALAEVGGRCLRVFLTRKFSLSRSFAVNSLVGNFGGILVADALLGPVAGLILWELIAGKTLQPRWNTVGRIILRLFAAGFLRFCCGLAMIILTLFYIFI